MDEEPSSNQDTEEDSDEVQRAAEAGAEDPAEVGEVETLAEPDGKRFGIYIVGNKYNPSNFWRVVLWLRERSTLKS